jgi:hypothetical protein
MDFEEVTSNYYYLLEKVLGSDATATDSVLPSAKGDYPSRCGQKQRPLDIHWDPTKVSNETFISCWIFCSSGSQCPARQPAEPSEVALQPGVPGGGGQPTVEPREAAPPGEQTCVHEITCRHVTSQSQAWRLRLDKTTKDFNNRLGNITTSYRYIMSSIQYIAGPILGYLDKSAPNQLPGNLARKFLAEENRDAVVEMVRELGTHCPDSGAWRLLTDQETDTNR